MPSADSHRRGRPPVMEPETRRRRVLDAAAAIFAEHGYAEASIEEIARACGMSRKTIYGLYPSKEELLSALLTGDWVVADESDPQHRREGSGLVAAFLQWHLERGLRSLRMVER